MRNYAAIKERLVAGADARRASASMTTDCRAICRARWRTRTAMRVSSRQQLGERAGDAALFSATDDRSALARRMRSQSDARQRSSGIGSLRGAPQRAERAGRASPCAMPRCCRHVRRRPIDWQRRSRTFPGLPHRMEEVGRLGRVLFVNDSKATNADSTEKALPSLPGDIYWILGGKPKEGGIAPLAPLFPARRQGLSDRRGERTTSPRTLDGKVAFERCGTLDAAVAAAARDARASAGAEPVVLLSPACASYDQFRNFERARRRFRDARRALPGIADAGEAPHEALARRPEPSSPTGGSPSTALLLGGDPRADRRGPRPVAGGEPAVAIKQGPADLLFRRAPRRVRGRRRRHHAGGLAARRRAASAAWRSCSSSSPSLLHGRGALLSGPRSTARGAGCRFAGHLAPAVGVRQARLRRAVGLAVRREPQAHATCRRMPLAIALCARLRRACCVLQPDVGQTLLVSARLGRAVLPVRPAAAAGPARSASPALGGSPSPISSFAHVRVAHRPLPRSRPRATTTRSTARMQSFSEGGFFGRGPGEGTIKSVLPDAHTDFIFAVVGRGVRRHRLPGAARAVRLHRAARACRRPRSEPDAVRRARHRQGWRCCSGCRR